MDMFRDNEVEILRPLIQFELEALVSSIEFKVQHLVPSVECEDVEVKGHQQ
jgi:hypothetical protein